MKSEDPLPLRKAKITQEAAVRLVQKAQKQCADAKVEAAAKKAQLEETQTQLEAAQAQLETEMAEAEQALEKAKAGGSSHGNFWFMVRFVVCFFLFFFVFSLSLSPKSRRVANFGTQQNKKQKQNEQGRALYEADKSLARARQKYDHTKPFEYVEG
jgi:preprotein translocase subunit SecG